MPKVPRVTHCCLGAGSSGNLEARKLRPGAISLDSTTCTARETPNSQPRASDTVKIKLGIEYGVGRPEYRAMQQVMMQK